MHIHNWARRVGGVIAVVVIIAGLDAAVFASVDWISENSNPNINVSWLSIIGFALSITWAVATIIHGGSMVLSGKPSRFFAITAIVLFVGFFLSFLVQLGPLPMLAILATPSLVIPFAIQVADLWLPPRRSWLEAT